MNSHFISRFLSTPWEFKERQLYYVDVEAKTLSHRSSRNLFAVPGLNPQETEERLNELVETPVGRYRNTCAGGSPPSEIPWDVHRALFLIVLLQLPRVVEAVVGKSDYSLDDVLRHSETELDNLVRYYDQSRDLLVLTTPNDVLFYPSSGVFFVPLKCGGMPTPLDHGVAIPLDRTVLALMAPKGVDLAYLSQHTAKGGWFSLRSASIDRLATKVVIAPELVDAHDPSLIVESVLEYQTLNRTTIERIMRIQSMLGDARSIAGLD